jgi:hypothetical protein
VIITASGFVDADSVAADQRAARIPGRATLAGARHDEAFSRRARARVLFMNATIACLPEKRGGGAPKGASSHCPRRAIRCCHLNALRARCPHPTLPRTRGRAGRGLASRRSAAALAKATERFGSAQAALHAKERAPALPAPSVALKRSTPHPGRSAGGDDARAARGLRIASKFRQFIIIYQLYDGSLWMAYWCWEIYRYHFKALVLNGKSSS